MNKERRRQLTEALEMLTVVKDRLEIIRDEEQEYYDNMPESFQDGTKGERAQEAIDSIESIISSLDDAIDGFSGIEGVG
jgi:flagellar biosynthesis chaperone FliJ